MSVRPQPWWPPGRYVGSLHLSLQFIAEAHVDRPTLEAHYGTATSRGAVQAEMRRRIRRLIDERLKHLQPRERVRLWLLVNPERSDRQIANLAGVSAPTVGTVRRSMVAAGRFPNQSSSQLESTQACVLFGADESSGRRVDSSRCRDEFTPDSDVFSLQMGVHAQCFSCAFDKISVGAATDRTHEAERGGSDSFPHEALEAA